MGKSSNRAPAPPDPYATAGAQQQMNNQSADYSRAINNVNTYTPLGSSTYEYNGRDLNTGAPLYRQEINLSPEQQRLYDTQTQSQQRFAEIGQGQLGHLATALQQPLSTEGLTKIGDPSQVRQNAQDALYRMNTAYLDPQMQRGENSERTRLANMGHVEGSEAHKNAMGDFNQSKEMAYRMARDSAIAQGGTEASRQFGMDVTARNQGLNELFAMRNQPLAEYNAFQSGAQPQMPNFSGPATVGTNPADLQGQVNQNYQGQLGIYNAQQAGRNNLLGSILGLGGNLGAAAIANPGIFAMMSDERVKEDIEPIGELPTGETVYEYKYSGTEGRHIGVMAQEIEKTDPLAVTTGDDGIKRVNYARVLARQLEAANG
jgi:hypothetical protein